MRSRTIQFVAWLLVGVVSFGGLLWDLLVGYGPVLLEVSEKVRTLIGVSVALGVVLYVLVFVVSWWLASRDREFVALPSKDLAPSHLVAGLLAGGVSVVWMILATFVANWLFSDQGIEMRQFSSLSSVLWFTFGVPLGLSTIIFLSGVGGVKRILLWFRLPAVTQNWAGVVTSAFLFVLLVATPAAFPEYVDPTTADYLSLAFVYGVPALLASFMYWRRSLLSAVIAVGVFTLLYDAVLGVGFGFSLLS